MIRSYPAEKWKEIKVNKSLKFRYAISNYGRFVSFVDSIENGKLLKGVLNSRYASVPYKIRRDDKIEQKNFFIHKLVAEYFLEKRSADHAHVIHLDWNNRNNHFENLKWVTNPERIAHYKKSPLVINARKKLIEHNIKSDGRKLTSTKVMFLKKILLDPNRKNRMTILARQFGVSVMQLHRIKTGENWGHIKV